MAAKPVRFHEQADAEYEDALDWYLARSPQAAAEFAEELTRAVELIAGAPHRGHAIALVLADFCSIVCFDLSRTSFRRASPRRRPYPPQTWLLERSRLTELSCCCTNTIFRSMKRAPRDSGPGQ